MIILINNVMQKDNIIIDLTPSFSSEEKASNVCLFVYNTERKTTEQDYELMGTATRIVTLSKPYDQITSAPFLLIITVATTNIRI